MDARNDDEQFVLVSSWQGWSSISSTKVSYSHSFGPKPIRSKSHLPDVVVILNPSENLALIKECNISNIPTVGIVDTDTDPRIVTYAIPANMEVSTSLLGCSS
jgi:ribosomal protein S2